MKVFLIVFSKSEESFSGCAQPISVQFPCLCLANQRTVTLLGLDDQRKVSLLGFSQSENNFSGFVQPIRGQFMWICLAN